MARRKSPKSMTDAELEKTVRELSAAIDAAIEAAGYDDSAPEAQRLEAEKAPYSAEFGRRVDAKAAEKRKAKEAEEAERAKKVKARKESAALGRKYSATADDLETVLRQAQKALATPNAEGKTFPISLGGRSRRQQAAVRQLADDGYLKKIGKGGSSLRSSFRQVEDYGGQTFVLTPDGEERLRSILAAKGEAPPKPPEPKPKPVARIKTATRPDTPPRDPDVSPRSPAVSSSRSRALAEVRYSQTQTISRSVLEAVQAIWRDATPDRILAALEGQAGRSILNAVIAGQLSVVQGAEAFVSGAMLSQGASTATAARLVPGQLAGIAADGRALATLLYLPGLTTSRALALGATPEVAGAMGLTQMARLVATTIADTSRTATSVAMTATPACVAYVRVVKLPACSRCIILAGRQYSYAEGFKRHPKCDCGMEPMSDAEWRSRETASSPDDLYKSMSPAERHKRFGAAGVEAMEKGSDMNQVVNARRGMDTTTTGKKVTTEGTTVRGIGGKALNSGFEKVPGKHYQRAREARLMPEQILKQAHGDRELQLALLRKHGYIT